MELLGVLIASTIATLAATLMLITLGVESVAERR
jgi:hypothetical protein